jgi:hypothetical protein
MTIRQGARAVTAWTILPEEDRLSWSFEPLRRVGPLEFGMTFEQAQSAVADSLKVAGSQEDWSAGTGWAEFAAPYRPGSPFWGAALDVYFDGPVGLACVAVNALRGPQVTLDGIELVGRTPSRVEERFIDYADRRGLELRYSQFADPSSSQLGLVLRAQRAGDVVLSRPVMVAPAWADRCGDTEGHIPQQEWRTY